MTPAEARAELVRRLKSGDYQQGKYALKAVHQDTGETLHCCLGVGGEMAVEQGLCEWVPFEDGLDTEEAEKRREDGYELMALKPTDGGRTTYDVLPDVVVEFLGFRRNDGGYGSTYDNRHQSLAMDNDAGEPFDLIAETIADEGGLVV